MSAIADFERSLGSLFLRFSYRSITVAGARGTGHVMPAACWALLEHLDAAGPVRAGDIAASLNVDASSITPRLKVLEREGLVRRHRDPHDRRVAIIAMTEEGGEALRSVHQARRALFACALKAEDMETLPRLTETLDRLADTLRESLDAVASDQKKEARP